MSPIKIGIIICLLSMEYVLTYTHCLPKVRNHFLMCLKLLLWNIGRNYWARMQSSGLVKYVTRASILLVLGSNGSRIKLNRCRKGVMIVWNLEIEIMKIEVGRGWEMLAVLGLQRRLCQKLTKCWFHTQSGNQNLKLADIGTKYFYID